MMKLSDTERLNWLRLSRTNNVGPITFFKLLERYGSATKALENLPILAQRGGRKTPLVAFSKADAEKELDMLAKIGGQLLCACEEEYPLSLAAIDDAPPVLSVLGHTHLLNQKIIGMVGARNASLNGLTMAERLAKNLGDQGYVVASGLARGIDSSAHKGSLATGTIACVAGGVDIIYPKENTALYHHIKDQGVILSENPIGMEPLAQHFPRRNRLISGVSLGVVVVEASLKSGSLITARCAAEQGRDVFAVPGSPLDPRAQGPNSLLKDGAVLIERADDIISHLNTMRVTRFSEVKNKPYQPEEPDQQLDTQALENARGDIARLLSYNPSPIDDLIRFSNHSAALVQTVLLELEMAGIAQRLNGNRIVLLEEVTQREHERRHR